VGIGPVRDAAEVEAAIERGVAVLKQGGVCVIDLHVEPGLDRHATAALGQRATSA
jgi:hypothetical protein